MSCKDCKHFFFVKDLYLYESSPKTTVGRCTCDPERTYGNMTFCFDRECKKFEPYQLTFRKGDVFVGTKGVIVIRDIMRDYYPRAYRVRTTGDGGFSISEQELIDEDWELVWRETD